MNTPVGPISWVMDEDDLAWLLEAVAEASLAVVDLETTGLDPHAVTGGATNGGVAARIVLAALTLPQIGSDGEWDGVEPTTYVLPLSHPDSAFSGRWRETWRRVAVQIVEAGVP